MESRHTSSELTLSGVIIPTDTNRHGRPVEIGIESETFDRFIIGHNKKGSELFDFIFSEVEVRGTITGHDIEGHPIVRVDSFQVLKKTPMEPEQDN